MLKLKIIILNIRKITVLLYERNQIKLQIGNKDNCSAMATDSKLRQVCCHG